MKKNILKYALMCVMALSMASCEDFFEVETDNILEDGDYINVESEMYSGFIGVITKLQAIGDKAIYLTDVRGELLEPTGNTSYELYNIYNYDADLTGNSYADPAAYYDLVIACNDYLEKVFEYKEANIESINISHYESMVSGIVRLKAWTYLTIAKIYGEALWFDDPLRTTADLSEYPIQPIQEVIKSCLSLLDTGFDGIDGNRAMFNWSEWVDPEETQGTGSTNAYYYWSYLIPPYFVLYAELCLWDGQYQKTVDLIQAAMNASFASNLTSQTVEWLNNDNMRSRYGRGGMWDNSAPFRQATVSVIIYRYQRNQTNSLLKHFGTESPNEYLLAPSEAGMNRFMDPEFNPMGAVTADNRYNGAFGKISGGGSYIAKYRPSNSTARPNSYQDDVHIYTYRGAELYFFLAEALNNLGRFDEASALINQGLSVAFPNGGVTWDGFTDNWTMANGRTYADKGIRGTHGLASRPFTTDIKENDLTIMKEMVLEFPAEGKIYPAMVRVAMRHGDFEPMADIISEKYANPEDIKAKILNNGHFIKWDLK